MTQSVLEFASLGRCFRDGKLSGLAGRNGDARRDRDAAGRDRRAWPQARRGARSSVRPRAGPTSIRPPATRTSWRSSIRHGSIRLSRSLLTLRMRLPPRWAVRSTCSQTCPGTSACLPASTSAARSSTKRDHRACSKEAGLAVEAIADGVTGAGHDGRAASSSRQGVVARRFMAWGRIAPGSDTCNRHWPARSVARSMFGLLALSASRCSTGNGRKFPP